MGRGLTFLPRLESPLAPRRLAGSGARASSFIQELSPVRVAEGEGERRAQPPAPSPLTDSCNLLGKISLSLCFFFSAQEKILVVPITRKTKSSAGHQRLPEAGNNVQGVQWRSPSWEAEGELREDTGPGLSGQRGRGMTDRGTWKKDFPPKTLKSGPLSYIREMIQERSRPKRDQAPSAQVPRVYLSSLLVPSLFSLGGAVPGLGYYRVRQVGVC